MILAVFHAQRQKKNKKKPQNLQSSKFLKIQGMRTLSWPIPALLLEIKGTGWGQPASSTWTELALTTDLPSCALLAAFLVISFQKKF